MKIKSLTRKRKNTFCSDNTLNFYLNVIDYTFFALLFIYIFSISAQAENYYYRYDELDRLKKVEVPVSAIMIEYSYDLIGNRLSVNSVGFKIQKPVVSDSGSYTLDKTIINAVTTLYSEKYGNLSHEYCLGTVAAGDDLINWTFFRPSTDGHFSIQQLNLAYNQQYFVSVRIKNFAGDIVTDVGTSDGIVVLNPTDDRDNDGASNLQELDAGTNPFNSDSDNDLIPDGWEIQNQLNPLSDDALLDKDDDGFSNLREFVSQSNPSDKDDTPTCISDYDQDGDVDGYDLSMLIEEFGRSDCTTEDPCTCDKYLDGSVNEIELLFFREDFGRDEYPLID